MLERARIDLRPLRRRHFRNLWLGQAISSIGAEIATVAVPYQAYTLTHSTAVVGLLGLASLVPLLVVPLVGGALADAVDRRTVLLRTETGMSVVAALFLVNSLVGQPRVWALFVLQALVGRHLQPRAAGDGDLDAAARPRRRSSRRRWRWRASTGRSPRSAGRRPAVC